MKVDEVFKALEKIAIAENQGGATEQTYTQARQQLKELVLGCLPEKKWDAQFQKTEECFNDGFNLAVSKIYMSIEELFK